MKEGKTMYYSKTVKKYGEYCYTKTGKEKVLSDFIYDISHCKPDYIRETKTRLYIYFSGKYSDLYTLPISCKALLRKQ